MAAGGNLRRVMSEIKDLTAALDKLTGEMKEADLVRALRAEDATAALQPLKKAMDEVYNTQAKVLEQIQYAIKVNRERLNQLTKERDHAKWEKERAERQIKQLKQLGVLTKDQHDQMQEQLKIEKEMDDRVDALNKTRKKYMDQEQNLQKQRVEELTTKKFSNELDQKQSTKVKMLTALKKSLGKAWGEVVVVAELYMKGLQMLEQVSDRVLKWQDRLQKNLAGLALKFGASTDAIIAMREEGLKQLLAPDGLGALGFELEDIVGKLAEFREAFGFMGRVSQQGSADLIKIGLAAGVSAGEVGELARVFTVAGGTADDASVFMKSVAVEAARAGISSARLAKQFTTASKELFMLSGPKARMELVKTAGMLEKMGVSLDKLQGFTEMTDTFDQTAEAMAKLNTAFGTHLNALDIFAEQDLGKRFEMVTKGMGLQVRNLDNLTRAEKRFMAQALNVNAETLDAMITEAKLTKEQKKERDKMNELKAKELENQRAIEKSLIRSKQVLIAEQQITAKINDTLSKQMAPFYDAFAEGGGLEKGARMFDGYVSKWNKAIDTLSANLDKVGMGGALANLGNTFGKLFDGIVDFVSSEGVAKFLVGLVDAFSVVSDLIMGIVTVVKPVAELILGIVGKALSLIGLLWKAFKLGAAVLGAGFGGLFGGGIKGAGEAITDTVMNGPEGKAFSAGVAGWANEGKAPAASNAMVVAPSGPVQGKAIGGPTVQGQFYMAGETGPELLLMPSDGHVMTAQQTRQIVGGQGGAGGAGGQGGDAGAPTINVQVILDGEVIQERLFKSNLRRAQ